MNERIIFGYCRNYTGSISIYKEQAAVVRFIYSQYGNGRFVRKLLEEAEMNLAERVLNLEQSLITEQLITTIEEGDVPKIQVKECSKKKPIGFDV